MIRQIVVVVVINLPQQSIKNHTTVLIYLIFFTIQNNFSHLDHPVDLFDKQKFICLMMEKKNHLTITIICSNNLESAKVDIYDCNETFIMSQKFNNRQVIMKFQTSPIQLYCLLWIGDTICKKFRVQIPNRFFENEKIYTERICGELTFELQIEVFLSRFNNQKLSESQIQRYAGLRIKNIQQNILKGLQIEQFKRKLNQKNSDNARRGYLRKRTKNKTAAYVIKTPIHQQHQSFLNLNLTNKEYTSFSRSNITGLIGRGHGNTNYQLSSGLKFKKPHSSKGNNITQQQITMQNKQVDRYETCVNENQHTKAIPTRQLTSIKKCKKKEKKSFQQLLLAQTFNDLSRQSQTLKIIRSIIKVLPVSQGRKTIKVKRKNTAITSPYQAVKSSLNNKIF